MHGNTRLIGIGTLLVIVGLASSAQAAVFSFSNLASIDIPDDGAAVPYPSTIVVAGFPTTAGDVNVTLSGVTHTFPDDIGALLVGPLGHKTFLFDGPDTNSPITNLTWTFDDAAAAVLSCTQALASGTFRVGTCFPSEVFPPPAPPPPYATSLSIFNALDPNGTWSLYLFDFSAENSGSISGGWSLEITTVPEPSTLATLGLGLIVLLRRFRSTAA